MPSSTSSSQQKATTKDRAFPCEEPSCELAFTKKSDMTRHFDDMHAKTVQFVCCNCDHVSKQKAHMETHWRSKHAEGDSGMIYGCVCGEKSADSTPMRRHLAAGKSGKIEGNHRSLNGFYIWQDGLEFVKLPSRMTAAEAIHFRDHQAGVMQGIAAGTRAADEAVRRAMDPAAFAMRPASAGPALALLEYNQQMVADNDEMMGPVQGGPPDGYRQAVFNESVFTNTPSEGYERMEYVDTNVTTPALNGGESPASKAGAIEPVFVGGNQEMPRNMFEEEDGSVQPMQNGGAEGAAVGPTDDLAMFGWTQDDEEAFLYTAGSDMPAPYGTDGRMEWHAGLPAAASLTAPDAAAQRVPDTWSIENIVDFSQCS